MSGGSGHVSDSLIAVVLGPLCAALLVALVVFVVFKTFASRRRRQQRLNHGNYVTLRQENLTKTRTRAQQVLK